MWHIVVITDRRLFLCQPLSPREVCFSFVPAMASHPLLAYLRLADAVRETVWAVGCQVLPWYMSLVRRPPYQYSACVGGEIAPYEYLGNARYCQGRALPEKERDRMREGHGARERARPRPLVLPASFFFAGFEKGGKYLEFRHQSSMKPFGAVNSSLLTFSEPPVYH